MGIEGLAGDLRGRINAIEGGYEFLLAYAAQGITSEAASKSGEQLREFLCSFVEALDGLMEAFRAELLGEEDDPQGEAAVENEGGEGSDGAGGGRDDGSGLSAATEAALALLERDAEAAAVMLRFVAAQDAVSSQLIDNLNGSLHVRMLLTDVFVLGEAAGV